eukprot:1026326-Pelagomonas_calceolata.AAC.2
MTRSQCHVRVGEGSMWREGTGAAHLTTNHQPNFRIHGEFKEKQVGTLLYGSRHWEGYLWLKWVGQGNLL